MFILLVYHFIECACGMEKVKEIETKEKRELSFTFINTEIEERVKERIIHLDIYLLFRSTEY